MALSEQEQKAGAREVLECLRQAAISQSADDMSRLYAVDAVHEFPFTRPGAPSRLEGRDEIVNWIAAGWNAYPLKYERYRTLAIHDTDDPLTCSTNALSKAMSGCPARASARARIEPSVPRSTFEKSRSALSTPSRMRMRFVRTSVVNGCGEMSWRFVPTVLRRVMAAAGVSASTSRGIVTPGLNATTTRPGI